MATNGEGWRSPGHGIPFSYLNNRPAPERRKLTREWQGLSASGERECSAASELMNGHFDDAF